MRKRDSRIKRDARGSLFSDDIVHGAGGMGGGGGKGSTGGGEAENTLFSTAVANIIDVVSEGPIYGLTDGLKSIFLDDVPVENADGSRNFEGLRIQGRSGTEDQTPVSIIDDTSSEEPVGIEVRKELGPVEQRIDGDFDSFRVRMRIPSLSRVDGDGNIVAHQVKFAILWSPAGSGSYQHITGSPFTLNGKNTSPYYIDYEYAPPTDGPWDVRVERISEDETEVRNQSDTFWDAWVGVLKQKLIYPFSAYIAFSVEAEQFGSSIPGRSYDLMGRIVRVPSNYDPFTRTYSGFWDGSFKIEWTDNPAWIFFDLATNKRYGAGRPDSEINVAALYTIAKYCDEPVPDGRGGTEPRYTLNVVINTREEAFNLLNKIATSFRGMIYWAGGQLSATSDRPKEVSYVVTPANTERGMFIYRSTTDRSRANRAIVKYNPLDTGGKPDFEIVDYNEDIILHGTKEVEIQAWGCTSAGQARRVGEWLLYTLHHDTEIVSYTAGLDHDGIYPGQIIAIADPLKTSQRMAGGRIKEFTSTTITLDRPLQLSASGPYRLMVSDKDRVVRYLDIVTPTVETDVLELTAPHAFELEAGNVWIVFEGETGERQYQVTSVQQRGGRRVVTAALYNPSKFAYIERDQPLDAVPQDVFHDGQLKGPRFFAYTVSRINTGGAKNRIDVLFSWTAPADENRLLDYQLQFSENSAAPNFRTVYTGKGTSFTVANASEEQLKSARIRARGVGKIYSPWQTISNIELTSRSVPPPTPSTLTVVAESAGRALRVSWTFDPGVKPSDFMYVEIYRSTTNDVNTATMVATEPGSFFLDTNLTQGVTYFYWVRVRVHTANPAAEYSAFFGPQSALTLPPPMNSVLDGSITAQKIADGAVIASKLASSAVTHEKLAANSVYGDKIAAKSITASKLLLTDFSNVYADFDMMDEAFYTPSHADMTLTFTETASSALGRRYLQVDSSQDVDTRDVYTEWFPIEEGGKYRVNGSGWMTDAGRALLYFQLGSVSGDTVSVLRSVLVDDSDVSNTVASAYVNVDVATNEKRGRFLMRRAGGSTGIANFGGFGVRRRMNAELIVDGAITADHLSANSVTANAMAANSVNANSLQANSVLTDKIATRQITTERIAISGIETENIMIDQVTRVFYSATAGSVSVAGSGVERNRVVVPFTNGAVSGGVRFQFRASTSSSSTIAADVEVYHPSIGFWLRVTGITITTTVTSWFTYTFNFTHKPTASGNWQYRIYVHRAAGTATYTVQDTSNLTLYHQR